MQAPGSAPEEFPHIGKILKQYVKEHRLSQAAWARKQGIRDESVMRYFKNADMRIHTLLTISRVLNFNFFAQLASSLPTEMLPKQENPLQQKLNELTQENEDLKRQVAFLKELLVGKK